MQTTAQTSTFRVSELSAVLGRLQRTFRFWIFFFVVVVSFAYGLMSGLAPRLPRAMAFTPIPGDELKDSVLENFGTRFDVLGNLYLEPVGSDLHLNGVKTEIATFSTNADIRSLLGEQVKKWEARGYISLGAVTRQRGFAVASDAQTGERYSITAWRIPPSGQKPGGRTIQGIIGIAQAEMNGEDATAAAAFPDLPLLPGGVAGTLVRSRDIGGETLTGVYNNPGSVEENLDYYSSLLLGAGWSKVNDIGDEDVDLGQKFQKLTCVRERQELTLLFSPAIGSKGERTVITLVRSPRL